MADINGRPNLLEDYLITLHNESWFYFTDVNNKTYENLRLSEKIWDAVNKTIIDNPHSLPSKSDCNIGLENLQSQWDAKKYQRDRAAEYPSIKDQLDDIYHNGIDGWKATIKATKDKYPKE